MFISIYYNTKLVHVNPLSDSVTLARTSALATDSVTGT